MQDFTKLKVWQKAFRLGIDLHRAIENGPKWNYPDLRGQTLRAAASIADTIAEGCGKESPRELARYCDMAAGSAKELLGELLRARALQFLSHYKFKEFATRIDEIRRMLWSLAASIRRKYPIKKRKARQEKGKSKPDNDTPESNDT
jgi:four helix bundle protein